MAALAALAVAGCAASVPAAVHGDDEGQTPKLVKYCAGLQQSVTDGSHSLAFYAARLSTTPVDMLLTTGLCTQYDVRVPGGLTWARGFRQVVPAGVRLYGSL